MKYFVNFINEKRQIGDCFEVNGRYVLELGYRGAGDEWKLVHGVATGQEGFIKGKRFVHGWVEYESNTVFDFSNGKNINISKDDYYTLGEIYKEECRYYSPGDVSEMVLKFHTWGPWDKSFNRIKY